MTKILEQWNTKTTGGSNKLAVTDFELIQDPIHLESKNYSALEIVDLIGRITNNRSDSGPIPATTSIDLGDAAITASGGTTTWTYQPVGEVHQIMGFSYVASNMGGASMSMQLYLDDGSNTVLLGEKSTTDAADNFGDIDWTSVYLDEKVQLKLTIYATFPGSGSIQPKLATVRVR